MIAQELEVSLHTSFVEARQQRHEFITVEHLLLSLVDNPSAAEVLRACAADIDDLRKSLSTFIRENTPTLGGAEEVDTQPTLGFQRVIQRAIMHVQSTGGGRKEVTGANVLVAIFGEKDSHSVYYLHQQGITRLDVVNYIAHGIRRDSAPRRDVGASSVFSGAKREPEAAGPIRDDGDAGAASADGADGSRGAAAAYRLERGTHVMLSDLRLAGASHPALLTAARGCCVVLSINADDEGLTLYTQEQVDALHPDAALALAAQEVCLKWKQDRGADELRQAIEALARALER